MKFLVIVRTLLFSVLVVASAGAADIYSLIQQGKMAQAREELRKLSRDSARSGDGLYFKALLEGDGLRSAGLLEDALQKSPDTKYREDITLRLAQYYVSKGDYRNTAEVLGAGKTSIFEGQRLRVLAAEKHGSPDDARLRIEAMLKSKVTPEQKQWLGIDQARIALAEGKHKSATTSLQSLVKSKNRQIAPQALYLLCLSAIEGGKVDEAARWYNLLKDQFPGAVGLDGLVEKLGDMPSETSADTRAEKATGTFYSVKVGVFSSEDNATQQAAKFVGMKTKVETVRKIIAGKRYTIVYVGRYATFDDAEEVRQELESKLGEQYQVVAR